MDYNAWMAKVRAPRFFKALVRRLSHNSCYKYAHKDYPKHCDEM